MPIALSDGTMHRHAKRADFRVNLCTGSRATARDCALLRSGTDTARPALDHRPRAGVH